MVPVAQVQERHSEYQHNETYGSLPSSRRIQRLRGVIPLEITYKKHYWTYLCCQYDPVEVAHHDSIIVAVKGACRGNGKDDARGAIGVFFHEGNLLNRAPALPDAYTSQRADLLAALRALEIALKIRKRNKAPVLFPPGPYRRLRRVVVKTNSGYLLDAVDEHIDRWKENGYRNAKGQPVVNEDLFRQLDAVMQRLEEEKVAVQFYSVDKAENEVAYDLANAALNGTNKLVVMERLQLEKERKDAERALAEMTERLDALRIAEKDRGLVSGGVSLSAVAL